MSLHLKREGESTFRHKIRRMMRIMGIRVIYQKPNTSKKIISTKYIHIY
jgi:hypothetical protein